VNPRTYDCDVVVVGARAAGASTAMLLARAGLDVVVVDRSRYGTDTLSTHALMRGAVVQLGRWGLLDSVVAAGTPSIHRATFHLPTGSTTIDLRGGEALYAPRRTVLDPILVDAAHRAGARMHFGVTVSDVLRDGSGRVRGVRGIDHYGQPVDIGARLVVGADGFHSVVARAVDAPLERVARGAATYLYRYWGGVDADSYESVYTRTATAGVIPTNDDLTCVFVGAQPQRFAGDVPDLYERLLRDANPDVAERVLAGSPVGRTRRAPARPGRLRRPHGPGWALVGDAGSWKDPITAHGITDALRDAELLARAALAMFDGDADDDALGWYHHERDRLSIELFDLTDRIASGEWDDTEIGGLLRAVSRSLADEVDALHAFGGDWPSHHAQLAGRALALAGASPDSTP
jgi:flavin-dependent dehydrogenase